MCGFFNIFVLQNTTLVAQLHLYHTQRVFTESLRFLRIALDASAVCMRKQQLLKYKKFRTV